MYGSMSKRNFLLLFLGDYPQLCPCKDDQVAQHFEKLIHIQNARAHALIRSRSRKNGPGNKTEWRARSHFLGLNFNYLFLLIRGDFKELTAKKGRGGG
ncbi:hypothetical protein OUZ56_003300 [Daphnia magna]|uniref:Uncharacterized protein n=1 Tax=Daphnia magna TaxID=35525 RepID=A0ABR0A8R1_9CRUS|nr:hypothetical protein OUZ56_003300 [Daphnia magna]